MKSKRFFWLKLKKDFFRQKEIKKLRNIAGGNTFTIIYLEMLLLSLEDGGVLYYEGIEDSFEAEIALELDEDIDNVKITVSYLLATGLMVALADNAYELQKLKTMTGSESDSAERMRRLRDRQKQLELVEKASQCDTDVTPQLHLSDIEKEKEKELDKDIEIDTYKEKDEELRDKEIYISKSPKKTRKTKAYKPNNPECEKVIELYSSICKSYPKIRAVTDKRLKAIDRLLDNYSEADFVTVFENAENSDYLKGKVNGWSASLDWLINDNNFVKVLEGNYKNRENDKYVKFSSKQEEEQEVYRRFLAKGD